MSQLQIRLLSLGLFLCGAIAAVGDKLTPLPFIPSWICQSWPLIVIVASIVDRALHIIYAPSIAQAQAVLAQTTANAQAAPAGDPFGGQKTKV